MPIVYQYIQGASPISLSNSSSEANSTGSDLGMLNITISIGNEVLSQQAVPLNTTGYELDVDISCLVAQKTQYNVTCSATYQIENATSSSQTFSTNTTLLYLPDTNASVVKTDLRTGALWVRPADGSGGDFQPFIPQGFYVSFDKELAKNVSFIDQLKVDGFNTVRSILSDAFTGLTLALEQIHAIPPYDNATVFEQVVNRTIDLGLYFVYDLRSCVCGQRV
ncbi:hypothetical protein JVU11DRAFT_8818 [Chiua virens]|nr:hypothetical protein JVU11DRAFT_8818 [Chiua virens]